MKLEAGRDIKAGRDIRLTKTLLHDHTPLNYKALFRLGLGLALMLLTLLLNLPQEIHERMVLWLLGLIGV